VMAGGPGTPTLDALRAHPVPVVSFTFGVASRDDLAVLRATGALLVQTVTTVDEAKAAADAGGDTLAIQAAAAGGQCGTSSPRRGRSPAPRSTTSSPRSGARWTCR
jgi:nitronate monooxygenase